jgi:hypothetical protein
MLSEDFIYLVFLFIRSGQRGPLPLLFLLLFQSYCGINFFRISFLGMTSGQDPLGKTRLDRMDPHDAVKRGNHSNPWNYVPG